MEVDIAAVPFRRAALAHQDILVVDLQDISHLKGKSRRVISKIQGISGGQGHLTAYIPFRTSRDEKCVIVHSQLRHGDLDIIAVLCSGPKDRLRLGSCFRASVASGHDFYLLGLVPGKALPTHDPDGLVLRQVGVNDLVQVVVFVPDLIGVKAGFGQRVHNNRTAKSSLFAGFHGKQQGLPLCLPFPGRRRTIPVITEQGPPIIFRQIDAACSLCDGGAYGDTLFTIPVHIKVIGFIAFHVSYGKCAITIAIQLKFLCQLDGHPAGAGARFRWFPFLGSKMCLDFAGPGASDGDLHICAIAVWYQSCQ